MRRRRASAFACCERTGFIASSTSAATHSRTRSMRAALRSQKGLRSRAAWKDRPEVHPQSDRGDPALAGDVRVRFC